MTAQATDLILIDGVQHNLFTNPLDAYREKYRRDMIFLEDHPNTACWRGYVAEWEIDEGRLFLLKVVGNISYKGRGSDYNIFYDKIPATLSEIFGPVSGRVPATWYSGELRVPLGEMVEYVHAGYGSRYPKYLLISVENGVCGEQKYVSHEEYKELMAEQDQDSSNNVEIKMDYRSVEKSFKADRKHWSRRLGKSRWSEGFIASWVLIIFVTLLIGSLMIWG